MEKVQLTSFADEIKTAGIGGSLAALGGKILGGVGRGASALGPKAGNLMNKGLQAGTAAFGGGMAGGKMLNQVVGGTALAGGGLAAMKGISTARDAFGSRQ